MIYQNYYLSDFPDTVYQKRGDSWFNRKKGSKDKWLTAPFDEQMALQHLYGDKFLGKYSLVVRLAVLGVVLYGGYKGFQYIKNQPTSTKSNSPT